MYGLIRVGSIEICTSSGCIRLDCRLDQHQVDTTRMHFERRLAQYARIAVYTFAPALRHADHLRQLA